MKPEDRTLSRTTGYAYRLGMPDASIYALIWVVFYCGRRVLEKAVYSSAVMFKPHELGVYAVAVLVGSLLPLVPHRWRRSKPALSSLVTMFLLCCVCLVTFVLATRIGVINGVFALLSAAAISLDAHRKELYFRCLGVAAFLKAPLWESIVFGLCGLTAVAVGLALLVIWNYDFGDLRQNQLATLQSFLYGIPVIYLAGWRCWLLLTGRLHTLIKARTGSIGPKIFLSHSSKDKPFVRRLASDLNRNGVRVWFDEQELSPGDSLVSKVERGLDTSMVVVVVISQNSVNSNWVRSELNYALDRQSAKAEGMRIIPVKIDDAETPLFLKAIYYVDFRKEGYIVGFGKLLKGIIPAGLGENTE